jgi:glycosyltransferase involved in cell wall biosynthesis
VDVVIPVFNERASLDELLRRLRALDLELRPIFVDNGSTDGTLELLRDQQDVRLIEHESNLGYGASVRDGIEAGTNRRVVVIDADLEFPPEQIPTVVSELEHHRVVYASRFLGRRASEIGMPRLRILGNRLISRIFNLLYGQSVTDLYTGFKGLHREDVARLRLDRSGFEHVLELSARLSRSGRHIAEVPIAYRLRRTGSSKMRHLAETLKFLILVVRYRFDRPA